jgi:pimeloyl-ACP methyl ester carboxylesterase
MTRPTPVTLALDRAGQGPPLVLLHPLGADRHVWDPLRALLTARRELITIDLPGFGASPALPGQTPTPRALAAAVAEHLTAIGVERPHVAGNSLGGWVALELGLSGMASGVTGIAPAGLWPEPLVPKAAIAHRLARTLRPLAPWCAGTGAGRRVLLSSAVAHPRRVPAAAARQLVRAYAVAPDFVRVNDAMRAGRFEGLERIRCPVTLVWPDHDRLIRRPVWVPDRVRNVVLTDAGHMPMWDAPDALADVLLRASGEDHVDAAANREEELAGEAS